MRCIIKKALIVDDETDYLALMNEFSAHIGLEGLTLQAWDSSLLPPLDDIDLLFLDINMPNKDGIDAVYELGKLGFNGGLIIMSGADSRIRETVVKLALSLNLNYLGSLTKPFRLTHFKHLVGGYQSKINAKRLESRFHIEESYTLAQLKGMLKSRSLYPVYQPQVDSASHQVTGIECLVRVTHRTMGLIPPPVFIADVTKAGLIDELTLLLITQALGECGSLLEADRQLRISFNIVSSSLTKKFIEQLLEILLTTSVALNQIILEITETFAISLSAEALYCVAKCRSKGMSLSLDDFGTGYATVKQLYDLPFNEIKIDRSFIANISNDVSNAIVRATVNIGRQLNYRLIAEGVETQQQKNIIDAMGPVVIQGYYFSKPLSVAALIEYLAKQQANA